MPHVVIIIGVVAQLCGALIYVKEIIYGQVKPNRVSWLMWSAAPLIAAAASFKAGAGWAAVPVLMQGLSPLLIFGVSLFNKRSYWQLTQLDYLCGLFSLLALVLWVITNNPTTAIVFAMISDLFAAVPTLTKSWHHPTSENGLAYVISILTAFTSFFVITKWDFASYAFPAYLVLLNIVLSVTIYFPRTRVIHQRL